MRSTSKRCREVGAWVLFAVDRCQRDLLFCHDLLVEHEGEALGRIEGELFAAHRALDELRSRGHYLAGGSVSSCALLRGLVKD